MRELPGGCVPVRRVPRRRGYPQVVFRATDLMTRAIAVLPATTTLDDAARALRHRRARLLLARVAGGWGAATPGVVEGARALGLGRASLGAVLWGAPAVTASWGEVAVRRALGPGCPFVVVVGRGRPVGAVLREPGAEPSLAAPVPDLLGRLDGRVQALLRSAGRIGGASGWPVMAVGGMVRDLACGARVGGTRDIDVAVEGDGLALAAGLAAESGGRLVRHPAFLTATVTLPDGTRVDVATARRERYARPGALPTVEAATLAEDLGRRDFTINALGIRLDGGGWGRLLDPTGGLPDLRRRRIRVLHPLSFVEDPTRIFRAVRFAIRLGLVLDRTTRRLLLAAARLPVYPALSGDRIRAELEALLGEPATGSALARLGRLGGFRVVAPSYRWTAATARLVTRTESAVRDLALAPDTALGLYVLALSAHLGPAAADAWMARLALGPARRASLARVPPAAAVLRRALLAARHPADAYRVLVPASEAVLGWAYAGERRPRSRAWIGRHRTAWRHVRPLLDGRALVGLGFAPGPAVGRTLRGLVAAQVAGEVHDRAGAIRWARRCRPEPVTEARGRVASVDQRGGEGCRSSTCS